MLSMVVFSLISMAAVMGIYQITMQELSAIIQAPTEQLRDVWILRITNGFTLLGTFLVSSFIFTKAAKARFGLQTGLAQEPYKKFNIPLAILLSATCFLSVLLFEVLVEQLGTPSGAIGDYINKTQEHRNLMDNVMLTMQNTKDLIFTVFFIGLIPAICEEVFFRGILMRMLIGWTKKPHLAIFIQALVFSLMHFNYIGTIPIMFIALAFGYIVYITGYLWYSVAMHFVNNGLLVCLVYFGYSPDLWPESILFALGIPSLAILVFIILKKYKNRIPFMPFYPKPELTYQDDTYENE